MRSRNKPEEPQEEGAPAWMNTYGDMVTLVLTFFVLLFSFSTVDAEKWEEVVNSLSGVHVMAITAMDPNAVEKTDEDTEGKFVITSTTPAPEATPFPTPEALVNGMDPEDVQESFNELYIKLKNYIEENNLGYILIVEYTDEHTLLLRMSDSAFFEPGSATLNEASKTAIEHAAVILTEYAQYIQKIHIEGYTDNVPIHNANYDDNWDLSYGRANTVRGFLVLFTELDPSLLAVTANGEYQPVASNDTPEGRAQNRRVDFVIESILKG